MSRSFPFIFGVVALLTCGRTASEAEDKAHSAKKPFSIAKETTYITEPVDKDGFIDYAAALNDRLSAGVSKENNAVALLCQVFGPNPEGVLVDPDFYKRLGIDEPPAKGAW